LSGNTTELKRVINRKKQSNNGSPENKQTKQRKKERKKETILPLIVLAARHLDQA
jgi:hypothetical protein